jgi:hypothetical protein
MNKTGRERANVEIKPMIEFQVIELNFPAIKFYGLRIAAKWSAILTRA